MSKIIDYIKGKNRPGYPMKPRFIVIHNTANTHPRAGAVVHQAYAESNNRKASYHWAVDADIAVGIIPENEMAWHAGDGRNGNGNRYGIAIEVCENGNWDQTYKNAVKLAAERLKANNLPIGALKGHRDFSNKNCPRKLIPIWDRFVADVKKEMNRGSTPSTPSRKPGISKSIKIGDRVKIKPSANKYATGQTIPSWVKNKTYTIKQIKSDRVLLKEIVSWVFIRDLEGYVKKPTTSTIKVGSRIKIKQGARSYDGVKLANFVYKSTYRVDQIKGNRALIDKNGICTPVNVKDLILA